MQSLVFKREQDASDMAPTDEEKSVGVEGGKYLRVDRDVDLGMSASGRNSDSAVLGLHGALALHSSGHHADNVIPPASNRTSPLDRVAEWKASASRCGISPQSHPHSAKPCPSIWGIFPNLAPIVIKHVARTSLAWKPAEDLTGRRFGSLTVKFLRRDSGHYVWACVCDCGRSCVERRDRLEKGARLFCTVGCPMRTGRLRGSRATKASHQRAFYLLRRGQGLCVRCGDAVGGKHSRCRPCIDHIHALQRAKAGGR